ncbi:MAG: ROK family protein [Bryobacterales bacterium]|nr:ROK family protein [Bryobacterales bacterium]
MQPGSSPRHLLALDLGGTKLATAIVTPDGEILHRGQVPAAGSPESISAEAHRQAAESGIPWSGIAAAGLIVPGIYSPRTGMAWAPNLWGFGEVPLGALQGSLPVPLHIASDRSGYVLGETWLGAARGLRDVVFLSIGTGIGAGILCGGQLVEGHGGVAGAVGWWSLSPVMKEAYRAAGCWESEAAGPAVARLSGCATAEEAASRARSGDVAARAAFDAAARWIGAGVANLISVFNPEMVILGGGLLRAADLLLEPVRAAAAQWAQPVAFRQTRIELTQLGENAGLLGAARLALQSLPAPPPGG